MVASGPQQTLVLRAAIGNSDHPEVPSGYRAILLLEVKSLTPMDLIQVAHYQLYSTILLV